MQTLNPSAALPRALGPRTCLMVTDLSVAYGRRWCCAKFPRKSVEARWWALSGRTAAARARCSRRFRDIARAQREVTLFGRPISEMRRNVAYMPQREIVDWEFPVTSADVVMMGRYPRHSWLRRTQQRDRDVVDEMLDRVGMLEYRGRQIGQLSGGQQQRIFIARALAQEADVLLLDEPMTGIDASTQEVIMGMIEEQRQQGKIVLLATHDLVAASCACDCLCCVGERTVSFGPAGGDVHGGEPRGEVYGGPVIILGQRASRRRCTAQPGHGGTTTTITPTTRPDPED